MNSMDGQQKPKTMAEILAEERTRPLSAAELADEKVMIKLVAKLAREKLCKAYSADKRYNFHG